MFFFLFFSDFLALCVCWMLDPFTLYNGKCPTTETLQQQHRMTADERAKKKKDIHAIWLHITHAFGLCEREKFHGILHQILFHSSRFLFLFLSPHPPSGNVIVAFFCRHLLLYDTTAVCDIDNSNNNKMTKNSHSNKKYWWL